MSEENADIMTLMLENVVKSGTASDITLKENIACAGKTGTTQNKFDSWYIGYTPYYIGGVWLGYEYPKALTDFQGNVCVGIWDDVMSKLHKTQIEKGEGRSFDISDKIVEYEYCVDSGKVLTDACLCDPRGDRTEVGYFVEGSVPTAPCDRHLSVNYDMVSGGVVIGECPSENIKKVGLINVVREFPMQIYVTDAQYTWRDIEVSILPETSQLLPFYNNLLPKDIYSGISRTDIQYNRACREHFNYFEWKKKQE